MCLEGYLGMFRKSQEVWASNFDPKGVYASRKPNPGTLCPNPPACDRVKGKNVLLAWLNPGTYIFSERPFYSKAFDLIVRIYTDSKGNIKLCC